MNEALIDVSDRAIQEIRAIFEREQPESGTGLRLGVVGGGCSGLSYSMEFSAATDADNIVERDGIVILLDPKSTIYLKGIVLDYQDGLQGRGFVFNNPNARNTCGCGESFSL